jgi:hypothetical protein
LIKKKKYYLLIIKRYKKWKTKKKITLNELRSLVKKILKEEHTFTSKQLHSYDEIDHNAIDSKSKGIKTSNKNNFALQDAIKEITKISKLRSRYTDFNYLPATRNPNPSGYGYFKVYPQPNGVLNVYEADDEEPTQIDNWGDFVKTYGLSKFKSILDAVGYRLINEFGDNEIINKFPITYSISNN